jgi:hypothetical protein
MRPMKSSISSARPVRSATPSSDALPANHKDEPDRQNEQQDIIEQSQIPIRRTLSSTQPKS